MTCITIPTSVLLLFGSMLFTMGLYNAELLECFSYMYTNIRTKILTFDMSSKLMDLFWTGSYIYTFVKYRCGKLSSTFPLVNSLADSIRSLSLNTPKHKSSLYPWGSITRLYKEPNGNLRIIEDYFDMSEFEWKDRTNPENLARMKNIAKQLLDTDEEILQCLVLMAISDTAIISRVIYRSTPDTREPEKMDTRSHIKIFVPDYTHIDIDDSIELDIPAHQYNIVGNQILSAAFIGRLLKDKTNVFDDKYIVNMLDRYMNMNKLTCGDYIQISETSYSIRSMNEPTKSTPSTLSDKNITSSQTNEDDETKSWDKMDTLVAEAQAMLQ